MARRNDSAKIREEIVEEAGAVLLQHGPDKATIGKIMGSVGRTHGAFYAHFASKDDLVAAAVDAVFHDVVAWCEARTAGGPAALVEFVGEFLGAGCPRRQVRARTLVVLMAGANRLSPKAHARLQSGLQRLVEVVGRSLQSTDGETDAAQVEAEILVAELVGARLLAQASGNPAAGAALLARVRSMMERRLGVVNP